RSDRHFDAGLGIAADPLALVAQDEGAKAGNLHILSFRQRVAHVVKDSLDHIGRFRARQAKFAMDHVGEVGTGERASGFKFIVDARDPEVGHLFSPALGASPRRFDYTFVTEFRRVGNSTNRRNAEIFQYLSTAAPQVNPPPIASSTTTSPRLIRPSLTAVSNASGTDAADVLACSSTVTTTFSAGRPNFLAVASRIRAFAWCGTTQSTPAAARAAPWSH